MKSNSNRPPRTPPPHTCHCEERVPERRGNLPKCLHQPCLWTRLARHLCVAALVVTALAGCARFHERLGQAQLPPGAPDLDAILADLGANDAAIENFVAKGRVFIESPDFVGTEWFRGSLQFRRPGDLHILGLHKVLPKTLFELTCVGSEFLVEFPGKREPYYRFENEQSEDIEFSVSPFDIVRMFFPESWQDIRRNEVRLVGYDEANQQAVLEVGKRRHVRRRVTVTPVTGPAWVLSINEVLDESGAVISRTTFTDYVLIDGIRFPSVTESEFFPEETWLKIKIKGPGDIRINTDLDESNFQFSRRP